MRAIVGRLSDLRLRELFKLLASAEVEGRLLIDTPAGHAELFVRGGEVCGKVTPPIVMAYTTRSGSFSFRPEAVVGEGWMSPDDFLLLVETRAGAAEGPADRVDAGAGAGRRVDPLGELRESLSEIPIGQAATRIAVITADPRPYRAMESEWRRRGWAAEILQEPRWPEGAPADALVLHLPASGTLAGQESLWLSVARQASAQMPPIPTLWIGGLADPELRHEAIAAGVDFLLPAPMGEVGESARRFREEVTVVLERLLSRKEALAETAAEAFRDYFLALHIDASPAELRASLLRAAATSFRRGVLLAVRAASFETLGGFGLGPGCPRQLPRGLGALEHAVAMRRPVCCAELDAPLREDLAAALPAGCGADGEILPLFADKDCVGLFVGIEPLRPGESTAALAMLFARSGSVVPH